MRIKLFNTITGKVKSERGFTFLELIFVTVITGILSSTLILPFTSSINQGTRPEIYNTATYLAVEELERRRSDGYSVVSIGTTNPSIPPIKNRTYTMQVFIEYVSHSGSSFINSTTPTEYKRVTVTVSNASITNVSMSEILSKDFYNPYAN